jgi:hypothetical protein
MNVDSESRRRLSLSGEWQLVFDPQGDGLAQGWQTGTWPAARAAAVTVPSIWEVSHPDAEGVGFYRRTFVVPPDWAARPVLLHCVGAAFRAEAWVNGHFAGSHEGAYTPFWFDVTRFVHAGAENDIIMRVAGLSRTQAIDGQVLKHAPASKQSWLHTYSGLWGEVYLEAVPWVAVQATQVEPDYQRETALVEVSLHNRREASRTVNLGLTIVRPDGVIAAELHGQVALPPGVARYAYRVSLPRAWAWHYEHPHLYQLQVVVDDADQRDQQAVRFGMRDFTVEAGQFLLNGRPTYIRGILLQPSWPIGLVVPPDRDMQLRELSLMKEAGFNLIRCHIRPAPPGYLDLADEMGMLIYAEASLAWIRDNPRMLDHCRREVSALIERDFNHPSVVFWGIFNENPPGNQLIGDALVRHARALDPTRVVVDNSGGSLAVDQDFGWIDRASMVPSRATARQQVLDVHLYLGASVPQSIYEWLRNLGGSASARVLGEQDFGSEGVLQEFDREQRAYRGKVFVSEVGGGGMADLDDVVKRFGHRTDLKDAREMCAFRDDLHAGFTARQLDQIFGTVRNLVLAAQDQHAAGNTCQLEALLCNPRISGYVITQLQDAAWEFHAGLLDMWRNPKAAYYASQRLNRPQLLVLRATRPAVLVGERLAVALTLVNDQPCAEGARIEVSLRDPAGHETPLCEQAAPGHAGIHELGSLAPPTSEAGAYVLKARLIRGAEALAETTHSVLALPPVDWSSVPAGLTWLGQQPAVVEQAGLTAGNVNGRLWVAALPATLNDEDWRNLLSTVEMGATGIIGPLHRNDKIALGQLGKHGLTLQLHLGIGSWLGSYHWVPDSPLFDGLPSKGLAGAVYVDVLPWYGLQERGGKVLAGSLRSSQTNLEAARILWYSDIEAVPLGRGELIFCQYRTFEHAHTQPLAARLLANLLRLAAARAGERS